MHLQAGCGRTLYDFVKGVVAVGREGIHCARIPPGSILFVDEWKTVRNKKQQRERETLYLLSMHGDTVRTGVT